MDQPPTNLGSPDGHAAPCRVIARSSPSGGTAQGRRAGRRAQLGEGVGLAISRAVDGEPVGSRKLSEVPGREREAEIEWDLRHPQTAFPASQMAQPSGVHESGGIPMCVAGGMGQAMIVERVG